MTQIAALYIMQSRLKDEPFVISMQCEANDTCVNWQARVGVPGAGQTSVAGPDATSDEDALRGLRDGLIERCREIAQDIGATLPAFEAMQKEERGQ